MKDKLEFISIPDPKFPAQFVRIIGTRLVRRCICWKPTAPGHQADCPAGR